MRRPFFLALVIVAVFDCVIRFCWTPSVQQKFEASNHSATWWAIKDFYAGPQADVVLLGSSLMQQVVCDGEATYLGHAIDPLDHHTSIHLEDCIRASNRTSIKTLALATPGQFASDAALISSLIVGEKQPTRIIYGIAPRDFMDNSLPSPSATETFRLVSRISPPITTERRAYANTGDYFVALIQSALSSASAIYANRLEFGYATNNALRSSITSNFQLAEDRSFQILSNKDKAAQPEEFTLGQKAIQPENGTKMYYDNRAQYICSYQPFRPKIYNTQLSYFKDMLQLLRSRGVGVTIVNMPITRDNMELMVPTFYDGYLKDVKKIALANGSEFIDFNRPELFSKAHFKDTVHLNGYGGKRFVELLSSALQESTIQQIACGARARQVASSKRGALH